MCFYRSGRRHIFGPSFREGLIILGAFHIGLVVDVISTKKTLGGAMG